MKYKISSALSVITLISFIFLQSCNRPSDSDDTEGCESDTIYQAIRPEQELPYLGNENIRLISNTNDTLNFVGTGRQNFYTTKFEPYSNPSCGGRGELMCYPAYRIDFVDPKQNEKMQVLFYFTPPPPPLYLGSEAYIIFKNDTFSVPFVGWIGDSSVDMNYFDKYCQYVGETTQRERKYNGVSKFYSWIKNNSSSLLINKWNGIIRIQLTNNETWELLNN